VITGFGRLGEWFASTRFALDPDIITCAKGLTSGYVPMGAVIIAGRVAEPFFTRPGVMWRHGYTYSGHATAAAVAMANLDILERERLIPRVRELEGELTTALSPLTEHALVSEVRSGTGFVAAIQLDSTALSAQPGQILAGLREAGVVTRFLTGGALQVSPSFVSTTADLKSLTTAVTEVLDAA
jgi:adenosylmethionine-8-amino-7-oxononanoate aminotransferase